MVDRGLGGPGAGNRVLALRSPAGLRPLLLPLGFI